MSADRALRGLQAGLVTLALLAALGLLAYHVTTFAAWNRDVRAANHAAQATTTEGEKR